MPKSNGSNRKANNIIQPNKNGGSSMNRILTIQQLPEVHKILKYAETRIRKVTGYRAYVKIENINLPSEPPKKYNY
ncbi:MAG: hypothetical protein IPP48_03190 [Chitinophagaceae bacterium]|nr:hypothetical protein [Chitinophagaceae bacterium]